MAAWLTLLAIVLAVCVSPLFLLGVDMNRLSPSHPPPVLAIVGVLLTAYTPTLAAVAIATWWPGGGGARRLFRQILRWRVHPAWYVLALVAPTVLVLAAVGLQTTLGAKSPERLLGLPDALGFAFGSLVAGAMGEELGWRGFAQPGLQRRLGALPASLIVGVVWATWHLWPWIAPGGSHLFSWAELTETYVRLISMSVIYAWIYHSTRGSLLLVMLAHTGHNIASSVVGGASGAALLIAAGYLVIAVVVVVATSPRTLTRPSRAGAP